MKKARNAGLLFLKLGMSPVVVDRLDTEDVEDDGDENQRQQQLPRCDAFLVSLGVEPSTAIVVRLLGLCLIDTNRLL